MSVASARSGHATPQFIEEVQQEDQAILRLLGRLSRQNDDDPFAVGPCCKTLRGRELRYFVRPYPGLICHERITVALIC